jgi:peptidoglycan/LPS O-acetylase OafA/YrhL
MLVSKSDNNLDLIRGLAAVLVCTGHLRAAMFPMVTQASEAGRPLARLFLLLMAQGHNAVMVFFVLSGYLVGGSVLRSRQFEWKRYLINRLSRLWVVLVPALLFTWLIVGILIGKHPEYLAGSFEAHWHSWPGPFAFTPQVFLANIFFLQTICSPVFGHNGPLWSLAYEFWYYLIFPALFVSIKGRDKAINVCLGALSLLALLALPTPVANGFLVWLMGAAAAWLQQRKALFVKVPSWVWLPCLLLFLVFTKADKLFWPGRNLAWLQDLGLGLGFAGVLWALVVNKPKLFPYWFNSIGHGLSAMSYSLYCTHFPLVLLIGAQFYGSMNATINRSTLAAFACWALLLLLNGGLFWLLFERHTSRVREAAASAWLG